MSPARDLLSKLARAAGLSALATATLASGPCGSCPEPYDECKSIEDFLAEREQGLAPFADGGAAGAPNDLPHPSYRDEAESWDGTSCPTDQQRNAIATLNGESLPAGQPTASAQEGVCCYQIMPNCGEGRPFLIAGKARVAELTQARSTLSALADAWLDDALAEHASVASFARLTLLLLSHGAPAELVQASQLAGLDELRHADFCFARASRHAERELRPGRLPIEGAFDDLSLDGLIESNLYEGCIGETLAALRLKRQADKVADPELRAALFEISEDEARHAELAFRILAWCREVAPERMRQALSRALRGAEQPRALSPDAREHERYLSERLSTAEAEESDREAWEQVLRPLFGHLAAASDSKRSSPSHAARLG